MDPKTTQLTIPSRRIAIGTKGKLEWKSNKNQQKKKCINLESSHATFKSCNMYWSFYEFRCYMIREVTGLAMPMMPKRDMVAPSSSLA